VSDLEQAAVEALDSVDSGGDVGTQEASVGSESSGPVGVQSAAFFEFEHPQTKEKMVFRNKGELADHLRHSSMRHEDYEKLSKTAQDRAKHFEERVKSLQTKEESLNEAYVRISKMDKFLKENPHVADEIAQRMKSKPNQSPDLDRLLEERMKPFQEKLSEYEKIEMQREAEARRQQAVNRLRERYPDADDSKIVGYLQQLQQIPQQDSEYALYELLYHALRGKETPAQVEQKFAQQAAKRRPPSVTSTPGRNDSGVDVTKMSKKEQAEYAASLLG
jgi:hypothetical protein